MPPGRKQDKVCFISWTTDSGRDQHLLNWLDANKDEREVLFAGPHNPPLHLAGLSKRECGMRAAIAIFSNDPDPSLRLRVKRDPVHMGKVVADHIRNTLKKRYRAFNGKIGPVASISRYKDIKVGGSLHTKIERLMRDEFPEWSRLHIYWRTIPFFNQYMTAPTSSGIQAGTDQRLNAITEMANKRLREKPPPPKFGPPKGKVSVARSKANREVHTTPPVIEVEDTSTDSERNNYTARFTHSTSSYRVPKPADKPRSESILRPIKRDRSEYEERPTFDGDSDDLTASQRHELRMAEIQLKRQKLELECQEKKHAADIRRAQIDAEARRQREKHEIVMHLMAFVTGGSGSDVAVKNAPEDD